MPEAGIKPNEVTYNTLIGMLRVEGDDEAAKKWGVVEEMKKAKVQPDEKIKEILNYPLRGEVLGKLRTANLAWLLKQGEMEHDHCSAIYDGQDGGKWRGKQASVQRDAQIFARAVMK